MRECKQLCKELGLPLVQDRLGSYNIEFYNGPPSQIKNVKGDRNFFFRDICYLLSGTEEWYTCIRLKVTYFIRSNGAWIQNEQTDLKQYMFI